MKFSDSRQPARFFCAGLSLLFLSACTIYQDDGPDPQGKNQKVFICHESKESLQVDEQATRAHLNHGDSLGRCKT